MPIHPNTEEGFATQYECTITVAAAPAEIFKLYADVPAWPSWDPEVLEATLAGPFASGAGGTIKPKGGPKSEIRFIDVKPNTSFVAQCKMPLCLMTFAHELSKNGASTSTTHRVKFSGLLAPLFGLLIGGSIKKTLPATMNGLKQAAESKK